ncbi:DNA repair-scaffolding protein isoform X1 [Electrophorus electricus]|nr:DNA repair-scaffolding protein isoform X1 [Electrophorus electricus]
MNTMSSFSKRKRNSRNMRCVLFPEDAKEAFSMRGCAPSKAPKSWERCSESFGDSTMIEKLQTAGGTSTTVQQLAASSRPVRYDLAEDPVHIVWSSSEEEQSDGECQLPLPVPTAKASLRSRVLRGHGGSSNQAAGSSSSRYCHLLRTGADTDDLPNIDSESEQEDEVSTVSTLPMKVAANISDCSSSSDGHGGPGRFRRLDSSALEPPHRSVSEWVRSVQALLHTPQKQTTGTSWTPKDSGKKRRSFESGGLAERLNRLQCRQRSAISFWKHQSLSNITTPTEERPGVLMLRVQSVQEVCGMQAALCYRPIEGEPCIALFCKETATHLALGAENTIYVYPPWQSLIVEGEQHPIILNTHFSQKVLAEVKRENSTMLPRIMSPEEKTKPYPLTRCLWQRDKVFLSTLQSIPHEQVCRDVSGTSESLLEAVEACGPSGLLCDPVEVVVQRVYFSTISQPLRHTALRQSGPAEPWHTGRLCMLVQDAYGMFSEVELQCVSSEEELKHYTKLLEGRMCVLQTLKVIKRLTRERYNQLFSLIDSLWPPSVPIRVHRDLVCNQAVRVPAPSFCYRLAGQQNGVVVRLMSPLYRPPVVQTLREILQDHCTSFRCSFTATVVYKREQTFQSVGEKDFLLFVTDHSLQDEQSCGIRNRTLPVHVSSSCLLHSSIREAITSSQTRPTLHFRDAMMEHGKLLDSHIFCWGQSVLHFDSEQALTWSPSPPKPFLLDQLSLESPSCSLCTLTGEVVGVDEDSAYSWLSCRQCGSDRLEAQQKQQEVFLCAECGVVDKPTTKMQLEVFLSCPSLTHSTVKIKLQQKSIVSLLKSTGYTEGYEVQNVLGKKVGPLSAFIHVISKQSTLWMGLEEIVL